MKNNIYITFFVLLACTLTFGQESTYVDAQGVFRWKSDDSEIRLFGVNYTLPFAHGYRVIDYLGKTHKKAIDDDVYHIARLGLDAFRIHVWDGEITDSLGNVIPSKQLDLLDYTLYKMKERGIKTIITPFKVGGNGYPEKDKATPGFSSKLYKSQTYEGKDIIAKQVRYFTQFLNRVNPYTGLTYKDDPDIIALEINNEPRHDNAEVATRYINTMVKAIRKTGFKNPIFYNVSERSEFVDAYCKANIQGCTFQWYPTGLVRNKTLKGNYLPNVDQYQIPFKQNKNFKNKARIVYEFDPADTEQSYLYPAMARSFREAKFQFATQFAYEPLALAHVNTEYQTHYLNLAYTPSKALSLLIASEVFHDMSNGQSYGRYPENLSFGFTRLDPQKDLAEYNSVTKFYYTNTTESIPKAMSSLQHIAGVGQSSVVDYSGTGAYFIDKLDDGVWRLEVMPDVLWVNDPFEKPSLNKTVAITQSNLQTMQVNLPDLGKEFMIRPLNTGNTYSTRTITSDFQILPGTYIIQKQAGSVSENFKAQLKNIGLNEYVAPKEPIAQVYVVHAAKKSIQNDKDIQIDAKVVAPDKIKKVEVVLPAGYQKTDNYAMVKTGTFSYTVNIPKERIYGQSFNYYIVVTTESGQVSYPSSVFGSPEDWDFISKEAYTTRVVSDNMSLVLYDSADGFNDILLPSFWGGVKYKAKVKTTDFISDQILQVSINDPNAKRTDLTFKFLVEDEIDTWDNIVQNSTKLVIRASSGSKPKQKVQIALQLKNGDVFGKLVILNSELKDIEIDLSDLKRVPQVLLPRPYPVFQAYWLESLSDSPLDVNAIEAVQISIGPDIPSEEFGDNEFIEIEKIYLK